MDIGPGIALDIDDTLSQTTIFWIEKMIEAFGSDEGMTAQQIREKYFYVQNVPYPSWSWENVKDKIHYRLTDEAFQLELKTVVDSVSGIQELIQSGKKFSCYLSNRPISIYGSTKKRLALHGYPELPITLRPEDVDKEKGNDRKSDFLQKHTNISGIIDDNPDLIEALPIGYQGIVYLFETKKYSNPHGVSVVQCDDWKTLVQEMTSR